MQTLLLSEVMGTKYIINALDKLFRDTLTKYKGSDVVLDLAHCRLGPDCSIIMREFYDSVQFCNSEDPKLDALLKNNNLYYTEQIEEWETLTVRGVESLDFYFDLARTLPTGGQYKIDCSLDQAMDKAIVVLLIMTRPDINFDIRQCCADIFDFVRDAWLSSNGTHEKYQELKAPNIIIRDVDENKNVDLGFEGSIKEEYFVRQRICLPIEFGSAQIIKLDSDEGVDDEWYGVADKCISIFESSEVVSMPGKVLRNLLTFREE